MVVYTSSLEYITETLHVSELTEPLIFSCVIPHRGKVRKIKSYYTVFMTAAWS